ncbi:TRADD-N-associated membrane domain-containing protein [Zarconia navalis]|nr:hypothetical protein [Zarconia navalis]
MSRLTPKFADRHLTLFFALKTSLPEKFELLVRAHSLLASQPTDPITAYDRDCQRHAKQTTHLAMGATILHLAIAFVGAGLLLSGNATEAQVKTASSVLGGAALACTRRAKDARDRYDALMRGLPKKENEQQ